MDNILCTQPVHENNSYKHVVEHMVCSLCVESPENSLTIKINQGLSVVGRENDCDIVLSDPSLSRRHALIELDDNFICTIVDSRSLNGTLRNHLRLKPLTRYELRNGDVLQFGDVKCRFVVDSADDENESFGEQTQLSDTTKASDEPTPSADGTRQKLKAVTNQDCYPCHNEPLGDRTNMGCRSRPSYGTDEQTAGPELSNGPSTSALFDRDDSDRDSGASARLLADVLIDTEDLSTDLLPNPSQFIDGSQCIDDDTARSTHPSPRTQSNECVSNITDNRLDVLVCETEVLDDERECDRRMVPGGTEDPLVTVPESEGFTDTPCPSVATVTPILSKSVHSNVVHQSVQSPRSTDYRPSIAALIGATPNESNTALSRITLARDSDPGPVCTVIDEAYVTHSSWLELPETQPNDDSDVDSQTQSNHCVEESKLFLTGVTHSSHRDEQENSAMQSGNVLAIDASSCIVEEQPLTCSKEARNHSSPDATQPMVVAGVNKQPIVNQDWPQTSNDDHPNQVATVNNQSDELDTASQLTQPMMTPTYSELIKNATTEPIHTPNPVDLKPATGSERRSTSQRLRTSVAATFETPPILVPRPSCKSTTRLIRHRLSSVVLSNTLGVVHFRSRHRRRGCATNAGDLLDSPSSCLVENADDFALTESSWAPIRRVSSVLGPQTVPTGKPIVKCVRRRGRASRLCAPLIPSPVRFSGSLLSEDPSQSEDGCSMRADGTVAGLDNKSLISRAADDELPSSNRTSETGASGSLRSPSALALAGFEYSPTEKNEESVSSDHQHTSVNTFKSSFTDLSDEYGKENRSHLPSAASPTFAVPQLTTTTQADAKPRFSRRRTAQQMSPKQPSRRNRSARLSVDTTDQLTNGDQRPGKRARLSNAKHTPPLRSSRRLTELSELKQVIKIELKEEEAEESCERKILRRTCRANANPRFKSEPVDDSGSSKIATRVTRRLTRLPASRVQNMTDVPLLSSSFAPPTLPSPSRALDCSVLLDGRWNLPNKAQVLFSGVSARGFLKPLTAMGITETEDVLAASFLITDRVKRTRKVLFARARGIPVVSVDWLTECGRVRKAPYPDPLNFLLDFQSSPRVQAKPRGRLSVRLPSHPEADGTPEFLTGWHLTCTRSVLPPAEDLAQLTRIAGGRWMSDRELDQAVANQLSRAIILCDPADLTRDQLMKAKNKARRGSLRQGASVTRALEHLPCVSVDWFLQAVMQRQSPQWPIDEEHRLYPNC